jgi:hypothetical protein
VTDQRFNVRQQTSENRRDPIGNVGIAATTATQNAEHDAIGRDQNNYYFNNPDEQRFSPASRYLIHVDLLDDATAKLYGLAEAAEAILPIAEIARQAGQVLDELSELREADDDIDSLTTLRAARLRNAVRKILIGYQEAALAESGSGNDSRLETASSLYQLLTGLQDRSNEKSLGDRAVAVTSAGRTALRQAELWGGDTSRDRVPGLIKIIQQVKDLLAVDFRRIPYISESSGGYVGSRNDSPRQPETNWKGRT